MPITGLDLKALLGDIGVKESVASAVRPDVPIMKQGLDSADCPAFAALIEERFGIDMDDQETLKLRSLDDYAAYINARKG
jgi:acyl carrier protein